MWRFYGCSGYLRVPFCFNIAVSLAFRLSFGLYRISLAKVFKAAYHKR